MILLCFWLNGAKTELAECLQRTGGGLIPRLFWCAAGAVEHLIRIGGQCDQCEVIFVVSFRKIIELNLKIQNGLIECGLADGELQTF